ncbi:Protein ASP-7, partial [Aphelenchoides avenae]
MGAYKAESDAFPASGQLLSTSMYVYAPRFVLDAVVSELGAEYYWPTDNYVIPCDQISSLPDMIFGLQGFEYRMSGKDYVRQ